MCHDLDSLIQQLDRLLEEHGAVPCLFALAHAIRGQNDKACTQGLPEASIRTGVAREYLANQITGLTAFWRIHVPTSQRR